MTWQGRSARESQAGIPRGRRGRNAAERRGHGFGTRQRTEVRRQKRKCKTGVDSIPQSDKFTQMKVGKAELPELISRLRKATSERGMKAKLARAMGVSLPRISEWLAGTREPGGETPSGCISGSSFQRDNEQTPALHQQRRRERPDQRLTVMKNENRVHPKRSKSATPPQVKPTRCQAVSIGQHQPEVVLPESLLGLLASCFMGIRRRELGDGP